MEDWFKIRISPIVKNNRNKFHCFYLHTFSRTTTVYSGLCQSTRVLCCKLFHLLKEQRNHSTVREFTLKSVINTQWLSYTYNVESFTVFWKFWCRKFFATSAVWFWPVQCSPLVVTWQNINSSIVLYIQVIKSNKHN